MGWGRDPFIILEAQNFCHSCCRTIDYAYTSSPPGTRYQDHILYLVHCCCCCFCFCCLHIKPFVLPNIISSTPTVSVLVLHPREIQILWSQTVKQRKTKQSNGELFQVGKSNANVPGTRAQQTRLPRAYHTKYSGVFIIVSFVSCLFRFSTMRYILSRGFVTTELVSLGRRIGTDTGCAVCRRVERTVYLVCKEHTL